MTQAEILGNASTTLAKLQNGTEEILDATREEVKESVEEAQLLAGKAAKGVKGVVQNTTKKVKGVVANTTKTLLEGGAM